ncbi:MAG: TolC family outer membrane protein [Deltaproteobacteria bacterium]|nr:TolC family outer membrane protein [Deltaproteobacteria bacterium]
MRVFFFKARAVTGFIRYIIIITLALMPAFSANAEDLLEVYHQALATNPAIARALALADSNRASHNIAKSALMPRINASASAALEYKHISGFGDDFKSITLPGGGFGDINDTYYGKRYSVTLTQPLLNGRAWSDLKAANARIRAAQAAVTTAEQGLAMGVINGYFKVLKAMAGERVARGRKKLFKEILDQAQARLKAGVGDRVAISEARAAYDASASTLINAENNVSIAMHGLCRLAHANLGKLKDVYNVKPLGPEPDEIGPWKNSALENQPLLIRAAQDLKTARYQVEAARRARWPYLGIDAGYAYDVGSFLPSTKTVGPHAGLVFSLPIYEGGGIGAGIEQARARENAEKYRVAELKDQVIVNVETAFLNLKTSAALLFAADQSLKSAKTALAATRKGYQVGSRSIIDLLSSAQDYETAEDDYSRTVYSHLTARAALKAAAGVISEADVKALNSEVSP